MAEPPEPPKGKKGAGSDLNRKVGGLPVWAWGVAAVAGLLIGNYLRKRSAGATAAAGPVTSGSNGTPSDYTSAAAPPSTSSGGGSPVSQIDQNLLAALIASEQGAYGTFASITDNLAGLANSSTQGALNLAGTVTNNAFGFATATNQAAYGLAASALAYGGGGWAQQTTPYGSTSAPAPVSSAPSQTYASGAYTPPPPVTPTYQGPDVYTPTPTYANYSGDPWTNAQAGAQAAAGHPIATNEQVLTGSAPLDQALIPGLGGRFV